VVGREDKCIEIVNGVGKHLFRLSDLIRLMRLSKLCRERFI